jgi:hypothetical protein
MMVSSMQIQTESDVRNFGQRNNHSRIVHLVSVISNATVDLSDYAMRGELASHSRVFALKSSVAS